MENTLRLYHTLVAVLSQHRNWLDLRHLKTLAWMMVGLIQTGTISLSEWAPFVHSRARFAQSTVRRFRRWLDNKRIKVHKLYGPIWLWTHPCCGTSTASSGCPWSTGGERFPWCGPY